jgi:3-hydroxyisobutyrate dehydrogenase-like beta-hydroxyacid dehydrogenase
VAAAGATPVDDLAAFADCDVVVSLVTPATAVPAAQGFAPYAGDGVLYVDLNSTAPDDKQEIAALLRSARVVDGVMTGGGIQLDRDQIPISLAGPDAAEAADLLNGAGLNAAVVGGEIGAAAALKMLRSVVIKGMEGLWVEALLAARERGVVEPLLAMIEETLDRYSARDFATMLVTTHVGHAGRRQVEVRMSRDTVAGTGVPPLLSDGIVARYERDARGLAAAGAEPGVVPPTLDAALEILGTLPGDLPG